MIKVRELHLEGNASARGPSGVYKHKVVVLVVLAVVRTHVCVPLSGQTFRYYNLLLRTMYYVLLLALMLTLATCHTVNDNGTCFELYDTKC